MVITPISDKLRTRIIKMEDEIHMILVESRYMFKLYLLSYCDISPYFHYKFFLRNIHKFSRRKFHRLKKPKIKISFLWSLCIRQILPRTLCPRKKLGILVSILSENQISYLL